MTCKIRCGILPGEKRDWHAVPHASHMGGACIHVKFWKCQCRRFIRKSEGLRKFGFIRKSEGLGKWALYVNKGFIHKSGGLR